MKTTALVALPAGGRGRCGDESPTHVPRRKLRASTPGAYLLAQIVREYRSMDTDARADRIQRP